MKFSKLFNIHKKRSPFLDFPFKGQGNKKLLISDMLIDLFETLEKKPSRWVVEFGVHGGHDGVILEPLISDDYSGVLIESSKSGYEQVKEIYKHNPLITCINSFVEPVGKKSLDNLLATTSCPKYFDVLLIDIDSIDYQVWDSFNNYHPIFVIIEFQPLYGPNLKRIHNVSLNEWVGEASFIKGSSIKSLVELGRKKGYSLVTTTRNDAYFVKEEFLHCFHLNEVNIDDIFSYSFLQISPSLLSFKQLLSKYYIYGLATIMAKLKRLIKIK